MAFTPLSIAAPNLRVYPPAKPGKDLQTAPLQLRDHQLAAVNSIAVDAIRQQINMPCGTGKTLTGIHGVYRLFNGVNGNGLVLSPTLSLLQQNFENWAVDAPFGFQTLAVCSRLSSNRRKKLQGPDDEEDITVFDLTIPVTNKADVIADFLKSSGDTPRVVFSTYQSLGTIIKAHAKYGAPDWDVALCDEAHRTAGDIHKPFARILHDDYVPVRKRLFMTATRRIHSGISPKSKLLASMDDEKLYGEVAYTLTVKAAIEAGILSEYRLAVIAVLDEELEAATAALSSVRIEGWNASANHVAAIVALSKAAREHSLQSVIAFFNSIDSSKSFVSAFNVVHAALAEEDDVIVTAEHIDGTMSLTRRKEALVRLASTSPGEALHLVSNARCLSEGVDVPALDGVLFGEPRTSQVDVVQCSGRGFRKHPYSDNPALLILAVRVGTGEDPNSAINRSEFSKIRQVIAALGDHDPRILEELLGIVRRGALEEQDIEDDTEPDVDGDGDVPDDFDVIDDPDAIGGDEPGDGENTDTLPDPIPGIGGGGAPTPTPHVPIRPRSKILSFDVPEHLLRNGFALRILDPRDQSFETSLASVRRFALEHGHANVPANHVDSDIRTGVFVRNQRRDYRNGRISPERIDALNDIPGWMWDNPLEGEDGEFAHDLAAFQRFVTAKGHALVPAHYRAPEDSHRTGEKVRKYRRGFAEGTLSAAHAAALAALADWAWTDADARFKLGLRSALRFADEHGHANVPINYDAGKETQTGMWCAQQRELHRKGRLSTERVAALTAIPGWSWNDPKTEAVA